MKTMKPRSGRPARDNSFHRRKLFCEMSRSAAKAFTRRRMGGTMVQKFGLRASSHYACFLFCSQLSRAEPRSRVKTTSFRLRTTLRPG
jgi:hypothetical protein